MKDIQAFEPEKVNIFHEETVVGEPDGDSETEPEEEDSGVDSDNTISEADSIQAGHQETEKEIQGNDPCLDHCVDLGEIPVLEHANTETNNDNKGMQQLKSRNHFSSFTYHKPKCLFFRRVEGHSSFRA